MRKIQDLRLRQRLAQMTITKKIKVFGRVQFVFFRDFARRKATELGIKGYVKNLKDGSVEIVAQGKEEDIDKFIEWAKIGPPLAKVDKIEIQTMEPAEEFKDFKIVY